LSKAISELRIAETPLAIYDLETTGHSSKRGAEIVEASVVRIEQGKAPYVAFDSLIKPRGRLRCTEIHQIKAQDIKNAPTFEEIAPAFAQALSGAIWVAYNVYFDLRFTLDAFSKSFNFEPNPPYFCAANARSLLKLGKRSKLSVTCQDFGINFNDGQHIAIYDTWMTARLMRVWLDRMSYLGLEHYGDLETLGTHKYLSSFQRPLWTCPSSLETLADSSFKYQKSRYASDLGLPDQDPRTLPPLSDEPLYIFGQKPTSVIQRNKTGRGRIAIAIDKVKTPLPPSALLKTKHDLFTQTNLNAPHSKSSETGKTNTPLKVIKGQKITAKTHSTVTSIEVQNSLTPQITQSNKVKLRPYQTETVNAILKARRNGIKRMVVCLPTGAGKTVIFSHLASIAQRRVLVLAHREELLTQAKDKLQSALGHQGSVEIEQGQHFASPQAKIVVASLRSLHSDRLKRLIDEAYFGLIIYDECHHAVADDNQRVLKDLGAFDTDFSGTLVGFTATTKRADGVGLDEVFETLVYTRTLQDMIKDQYLVPLRGYRISTAISLATIGGNGEFPIDQLEEKVDIQERNGLVARSIQELARDRRTICFCVTVRHAENLAQTLRDCGVPATVIHGEMKSNERARVLKDFREGTLQVLTNVGVLTEGFDDPEVSCIAMARPTRSEALYVQCVGRGMRLFKDKKDCIVLDFVDLSAMNLITLPTLYGMPVELDFEGREAGEVSQAYFALLEAHPGFEWEAESLTLSELKERAHSFDPLRIKLSHEVRSISQNGWVSLGQRGLALHFSRDQKSFSELLILLTSQGGKQKYKILLDGTEVAHESLIERAVEAADYEVGRMGGWAVETASMYASWRQSPPQAELIDSLRQYPLPVPPKTLEEVFRTFTYYKWV